MAKKSREEYIEILESSIRKEEGPRTKEDFWRILEESMNRPIPTLEDWRRKTPNTYRRITPNEEHRFDHKKFSEGREGEEPDLPMPEDIGFLDRLRLKTAEGRGKARADKQNFYYDKYGLSKRVEEKDAIEEEVQRVLRKKDEKKELSRRRQLNRTDARELNRDTNSALWNALRGRHTAEDAKELGRRRYDTAREGIATRPVKAGLSAGMIGSFGEGSKQVEREIAKQFGSEATKTAFDEASEYDGYKQGYAVGFVGMTALTYSLVGSMLSTSSLGPKMLKFLGPKIGKTRATFASKQALDLGVDIIARTPDEVYQYISTDEEIDEFVKRWTINRLIDVGMNSLIGGLMDYKRFKESFKREDIALSYKASAKRAGLSDAEFSKRYPVTDKYLKEIDKGRGDYALTGSWKKNTDQFNTDAMVKERLDDIARKSEVSAALKDSTQPADTLSLPRGLQPRERAILAEQRLVAELTEPQFKLLAEAEAKGLTVTEYASSLARRIEKDPTLVEKYRMAKQVIRKQNQVQEIMGGDVFGAKDSLARSLKESEPYRHVLQRNDYALKNIANSSDIELVERSLGKVFGVKAPTQDVVGGKFPLTDDAIRALKEVDLNSLDLGIPGKIATDPTYKIPKGSWEIAVKNPVARAAGYPEDFASKEIMDELGDIAAALKPLAGDDIPDETFQELTQLLAEGIRKDSRLTGADSIPLTHRIRDAFTKRREGLDELFRAAKKEGGEDVTVGSALKRLIAPGDKTKAASKAKTVTVESSTLGTVTFDLSNFTDLNILEPKSKNIVRIFKGVAGEDSDLLLETFLGEGVMKAESMEYVLKDSLNKVLTNARVKLGAAILPEMGTPVLAGKEHAMNANLMRFIEGNISIKQVVEAYPQKWKEFLEVADTLSAYVEMVRRQYNLFRSRQSAVFAEAYAAFKPLDDFRTAKATEIRRLTRILQMDEAGLATVSKAQREAYEFKIKQARADIDEQLEAYVKSSRGKKGAKNTKLGKTIGDVDETFLRYRENYMYHTNPERKFDPGGVFHSEQMAKSAELGKPKFTKEDLKMNLGPAKYRIGESPYKVDAIAATAEYTNRIAAVMAWEPYIKKVRSFSDSVAENSTHLKNFVKFLGNYADDLEGKTSDFITSMGLTGSIISELSTISKGFIAAGNVSMALAQTAVIAPQMAMHGPKHALKGLYVTMMTATDGLMNLFDNPVTNHIQKLVKERMSNTTMTRMKGNAAQIRSSQRILHRYNPAPYRNLSEASPDVTTAGRRLFLRQYDMLQTATNRLYAGVKVSDGLTASMIYHSGYSKGYEIAERLIKDAAEKSGKKYSPEYIDMAAASFADRYANQSIMTLIGGRTKGTTALLFRSKTANTFVPFMLEAHNYMQLHMDQVSKSFGEHYYEGLWNLSKLAVAGYTLNKAVEKVRGYPVTLDVLKALEESFEFSKEDPEFGMHQTIGMVTGEILSNSVGGAHLASVMKLVGSETEVIESLDESGFFTKNDPTRFGNLPLFMRPLLSLKYMVPGGGQLNKIRSSWNALAEGGIHTRDGEQLRIPVDAEEKGFGERIQAIMFGPYTFEEAVKYNNSLFQPVLTPNETAVWRSVREKGDMSHTDFYWALHSVKHYDSLTRRRKNWEEAREGLLQEADGKPDDDMLKSISKINDLLDRYDEVLGEMAEKKRQEIVDAGFKDEKELGAFMKAELERIKQEEERAVDRTLRETDPNELEMRADSWLSQPKK